MFEIQMNTFRPILGIAFWYSSSSSSLWPADKIHGQRGEDFVQSEPRATTQRTKISRARQRTPQQPTTHTEPSERKGTKASEDKRQTKAKEAKTRKGKKK